MKAPRKLLAVFSIALAFALTQFLLAYDAPAAPRDTVRHSLFADADAGDNTLLTQQQTLVAPAGGEGFPSQWQQLRASLDVEGNWRLAAQREGDGDAPFPREADMALASKVSEPAGYLALLAGLGGMALLRRAQMKHHLPWRVK